MDSDYSTETAAASSMYVYTFLMAMFVCFFNSVNVKGSVFIILLISVSLSLFSANACHLLKGFLLHVLFGEHKLWKLWVFSPLNSRWCFVCFFSLSSLFCLKGLFSQKLKFYHHVVPKLYGFLLWNTNEDTVKNVGNQTVSVLIGLHWLSLYGQNNKQKNNANQNFLVPNNLHKGHTVQEVGFGTTWGNYSTRHIF